MSSSKGELYSGRISLKQVLRNEALITVQQYHLGVPELDYSPDYMDRSNMMPISYGMSRTRKLAKQLSFHLKSNHVYCDTL
jgi:hypothetical protein